MRHFGIALTGSLAVLLGLSTGYAKAPATQDSRPASSQPAGEAPRTLLAELTVPEGVVEGQWLRVPETPFGWCYQGGRRLVFEQEGPRVFLSVDGGRPALAAVIVRSGDDAKVLAESLAGPGAGPAVWVFAGQLPALRDLPDPGKVRVVHIWDNRVLPLSDLTPLERFAGLSSLSLLGCGAVADLSGLGKLANLRSLSLPLRKEVSDLSGVAKLAKLELLDMAGCKKVTDLGPLRGLTRLTWLDLHKCKKVSDLSPLGGLRNLTWLDLHDCEKVSDLSPLGSLTKLIFLNVSDCRAVQDISPLAKLTELAALEMGGSTFPRDCAPLKALKKVRSYSGRYYGKDCAVDPSSPAAYPHWEELTSLEASAPTYELVRYQRGVRHLTIRDSGFDRIDVSPLAGLKSLETLDFDGCDVEDYAPLKALRNLRTLRLRASSRERPASIAPLAEIKGLRILELGRYHGMGDLAALRRMTGLTHLTVGMDDLRDFPPLDALRELTHLDMSQSGESVQVLPSLKGLTRLAEVDLTRCIELRDISSLAGAKNLRRLSLRECGKVADISALRALTKLEELDLQECWGVKDLSALEGMRSLKRLWLPPYTRDAQLKKIVENSPDLVALHFRTEIFSTLVFSLGDPLADTSLKRGAFVRRYYPLDQMPKTSTLAPLRKLTDLEFDMIARQDLRPLPGLKELRWASFPLEWPTRWLDSPPLDVSALNGLPNLLNVQGCGKPSSPDDPSGGKLARRGTIFGRDAWDVDAWEDRTQGP